MICLETSSGTAPPGPWLGNGLERRAIRSLPARPKVPTCRPSQLISSVYVKIATESLVEIVHLCEARHRDPRGRRDSRAMDAPADGGSGDDGPHAAELRERQV